MTEPMRSSPTERSAAPPAGASSLGARHVLVTGATGYVGRAVLRALHAAGIRCTALSRTAPPPALAAHLPFRLGAPLDPSVRAIGRIDAIVHLAAATGPAEGNEAAELESTRELLTLCRQAGARFVFASSQTASPDAPTQYGRLKWRIEQLVEAEGGTVVRIGLVYGGPERGLFGALCRVAARSPVLPRFVPDPLVNPIHLADLGAGLVHIALSADAAPRYALASPQPVPFSRFMRSLARHRVRRRRLFLPFPAALVRWIRSLFALLGAAAPETVSRLDSLLRLPRLDQAADDARRLGLPRRSLDEGMARSGAGARRALLAEGDALLRHLAGAPPPTILVRRFARAVEASAAPARPEPLAMATAWADAARPGRTEARRRVLLAARVLEASPFGAAKMIARERRSVARVALELSIAVLCDAAAIARGWLGRAIPRRRRRG